MCYTICIPPIFTERGPTMEIISVLKDIRRVSLPSLSVAEFRLEQSVHAPALRPELLPTHELVFVTEGAMTILVGEETYTAEAGQCLYASQGELRSRLPSDTPVSFLFLSFWEEAKNNGGLPPGIFPHVFAYDKDPDVLASVQMLLRVCREDTPDQRKKCMAVLQLVLIQIEDFLLLYSENEYVRDMKKYLLAHYREGVQLEDLASHVGLHPVYCSKLFKRFEGIPVGTFINRLRIARAAAQLEAVETTSQVAEDLGLSDFYFSRWFRSMTGLSPTEYRDTLRRQ